MSAPLESEIKAVLEGLVKGEAHFAYLLGSAGTSRFHQESDIDLAVYWKKSLEPSQHAAYVTLLEDHFQCNVDLVSINTADLIFSRQILETGRLLFSESSGEFSKYFGA